jgi:hypothetical protein
MKSADCIQQQRRHEAGQRLQLVATGATLVWIQLLPVHRRCELGRVVVGDEVALPYLLGAQLPL